jgi:hypothetical protein
MRLQPIDQPLHALPQTVHGASKGPALTCVVLVRHGDPDARMASRRSHPAAAIPFVTGHAARTLLGTTTAGALPRAARPQGFKGHGLLSLAWRQHHRHQLPPALGPDVDFGAEAPWTASQGFGVCAPFLSPAAC